MDTSNDRTARRHPFRNALGWLLAAAATALTLISPLLDWYGDRQGRDYRLSDLFTRDGITTDSASLLTGLFVGMLLAAVLLLLAIALRLGWLMALAGLVVLGLTVWWMVRQYQVNDTLSIGRDGLGEGVACALVAGVLALVAGAVTYGRGRGRHRRGRGEAPPRERTGPREEAEPREGHVVEGPWQRRPGEESGRPPTAEPGGPQRPGGAPEAPEGEPRRRPDAA